MTKTHHIPFPLGQVKVESRPRDFTAPRPSQPLKAQFGNFAELAGFEATPDRARPGAPVKVTIVGPGKDANPPAGVNATDKPALTVAGGNMNSSTVTIDGLDIQASGALKPNVVT